MLNINSESEVKDSDTVLEEIIGNLRSIAEIRESYILPRFFIGNKINVENFVKNMSGYIEDSSQDEISLLERIYFYGYQVLTVLFSLEKYIDVFLYELDYIVMKYE